MKVTTTVFCFRSTVIANSQIKRARNCNTSRSTFDVREQQRLYGMTARRTWLSVLFNGKTSDVRRWQWFGLIFVLAKERKYVGVHCYCQVVWRGLKGRRPLIKRVNPSCPGTIFRFGGDVYTSHRKIEKLWKSQTPPHVVIEISGWSGWRQSWDYLKQLFALCIRTGVQFRNRRGDLKFERQRVL